MKEKKLTDEEIVKALECCAVGRKCGECPYCIKKIDCLLGQRAEVDWLDLIHRLQNEASQWKSKAEHIEEVYDADREHFIKTTAEQKAEIEKLKTELRKELTEHEEFTQKAKAEIERIAKEKKSDAMLLYASGLACEQVKTENAELQKQVDELTAKYRNLENNYEYTHELYRQYEKQVDELTDKLGKVLLEIDIDEMLVAKGVEQAVKDTAKEIFTDLLKEFSLRKSCGNADVVVREIATRKGVEVE